MSEQESFNRLVQMASSDVVALVRPGQEAEFTVEALQTALALMGRHERMALLSLGTGWRGGSAVTIDDSQKGWAYVDGVASGPVFVRRSAFLEVSCLSPAALSSFCPPCPDPPPLPPAEIAAPKQSIPALAAGHHEPVTDGLTLQT